jgi:hypothetical protein
MSIGLYMDQHVPKAITDGLRLRGVDCITALRTTQQLWMILIFWIAQPLLAGRW